jgi:hypothetical protein
MAIALVQTTLTNAITANQQQFAIGSATGVSAPVGGFYQKAYIIDPNATRGELVDVIAVSGLNLFVSRLGMFKGAHPAGSIILFAPIDPTIPGFKEFNPAGAPLVDPGEATPWLNVLTGEQWLWSSVSLNWVPGWNNPSSVKGLTAAVASAAGVILPSGPLFHVTGTSAITGFTIPVGFAGGSFTIIADAVFSWTATGNIATASTTLIGGVVVVGHAYTFTWDPATSKFYVTGG